MECGGLPPLCQPRLAAAASCRVESGAEAPHSKKTSHIRSETLHNQSRSVDPIRSQRGLHSREKAIEPCGHFHCALENLAVACDERLDLAALVNDGAVAGQRIEVIGIKNVTLIGF